MSDVGKQRLVVSESSGGWRSTGTTLPQYISLISESLDYGVQYRLNDNLAKDTRMAGTESIILDDQKPEGDISFIPTPNSVDHIFRAHYQKAELTPSIKFGDTWQYTPESGRLDWSGGVVYGTGGFGDSPGDVYSVGITRVYDHDQVVAFNHGICDELSLRVSSRGVLNANAKFKFKTAGTLGTTTPWSDSEQDLYSAYSSFVGTFLIDGVSVPIEQFSVTSKNNMIEKMILGQSTRDSFTMGDYVIDGDFTLDFPDDGLSYLTSALQKSVGKISGTFYQSEYNHLTIDLPNITYKPNDIKLNSVQNSTISYEAFSNNGTSPITIRLQKPNDYNSNVEVVDDDTVSPHCTIGLDTNNLPGIAYRKSDSAMNYAKWDGSQWNIETVLELGLYAPRVPQLNIGSDNVPQISFIGITANSWDIGHAKWNGSSWDIVTADSVKRASTQTILNTAIDSTNKVGMTYNGQGGGKLIYLKDNGSSWDLVEHPTLSDSQAMVFDENDDPWFIVKNGLNLTLSSYISSTWNDVNIGLDSSSYGYDIKIDDNGWFGIVLMQSNGFDAELWYIHYNGVDSPVPYIIEVFPNVSPGSNRARLSYDSENYPVITYSDASRGGVMKIARYNGSEWVFYYITQYDRNTYTTSRAGLDMEIENDNTYHVCYFKEKDIFTTSGGVNYSKVTWGKNVPETTPHQLDSGTVSRTIAEYSQYDAGTASRTISEYARQDRDIK